MSNSQNKYVLLATCPDTIGINQAVNNFIYERGGNIMDAAQFNDQQDQQFFVRFEFAGFERELPPLEQLNQEFAVIAEPFNMRWQIFSVDQALPCSPLSWAERLKRVFDIDISVCPLCGGTLRVIADVTDPDAIQTILAHLRQRAPPDAVRRQRPGQRPQNDLFAAI